MRRAQWAASITVLVVVASLIGGNAVLGQVTLDPAWPENPRTFGGEGWDTAESIQQTTDRGYIVAGHTGSFGAGSYDVYLIKLDSAGNLDPVWETNPKTFGGEDWDQSNSVQQTADGGYIIAGWTESFGAGQTDVYLIKLDAQGNLDPAWNPNPKTFGGASVDKASWVQEIIDGGYIVAGTTGPLKAPRDVYLIKLDAAGNLHSAWDPNPRTFGGERDDGATSIQQTTDGGYIVTGWTESFGAGRWDVYLIKLDSAGDLDSSWESNPRTFGGESADIGSSVQQTTDGGYIVAGYTDSFGAGQRDVFVIRLDSAGNLDPAWDPNPRTFGGESRDSAYSVQETTDGGYVVAGSTRSFGAGDHNACLLKLDSAGNLDPAWDPNPRTFGGVNSDLAYSVRESADDGYVVAGGTRSFGAGDSDFYLIKLSPARHFLRGDFNGDGDTDGVADALDLLTANFLGDLEIPCLAACDANGDGKTSGVADALDMLTHNFLGGVTIPAPFPDCGLGAIRPDLGCETPLECN